MEPKDKDEYLERFAANQKITGFGAETTMHMPCAFCAAPEFMVFRVIDTEQQTGATCKECHRTMAFEVEITGPSRTIRMFQTGGPDQPDWLTPKMPRRETQGD